MIGMMIYTDLAIVHREIDVVKRMMRGTVDDRFERVIGNHIRIMNL